jgi:GNAT superfamily N-acetyltransferase
MSAALPIAVRRARGSDAEAILSFTRTTWDGWDYIPFTWPSWLAATDGVLLVATPRAPAPGAPQELDRFGRILSPDRPVAMTRMVMLSADEAWLEGLRVDPGVRNRRVGSLIHLASMEWARAHGARIVRYATGERNEGSHRIGEGFGFRVVGGFRSFEAADEADEEGLDGADPVTFAAVGGGDLTDEAFDRSGAGPEAPPDQPGREDDRPPLPPAGDVARAHARVRTALGQTGMLLPPGADHAATVASWWDRIAADPTFRASRGLYERRAWAFQALTRDRLGEHIRAGEVLVREDGDGWGIAIIPVNPGFPFEQHPHASLVAGDAAICLSMARATQEALDGPIRLRFPDPDPPMLADARETFAAAGFLPADDAMHVLERPLSGDEDIAGPGEGRLPMYEEEPRQVAVPRSVGT